MNQNQFEGKWNEVKGEIRSFWGKLTEDELEKTKGDAQAIMGLIEQRYGDKVEGAKEKLDSLYDKYKFRKDLFVEDTKDQLRH